MAAASRGNSACVEGGDDLAQRHRSGRLGFAYRRHDGVGARIRRQSPQPGSRQPFGICAGSRFIVVVVYTETPSNVGFVANARLYGVSNPLTLRWFHAMAGSARVEKLAYGRLQVGRRRALAGFPNRSLAKDPGVGGQALAGVLGAQTTAIEPRPPGGLSI